MSNGDKDAAIGYLNSRIFELLTEIQDLRNVIKELGGTIPEHITSGFPLCLRTCSRADFESTLHSISLSYGWCHNGCNYHVMRSFGFPDDAIESVRLSSKRYSATFIRREGSKLHEFPPAYGISKRYSAENLIHSIWNSFRSTGEAPS
jgi:hypothetical protein